MAVNTQFAIAVHLMAGLGCQREATSSTLAASVNTSPSFVRRVLAKLSKAGLVETTTGKSGCCRLARDAKEITLWEIHQAVDAPKAFAIHHYEEQKPCVVSCRIKCVLESVLAETQKSLEKSLRKITLAEVITDVQKK